MDDEHMAAPAPAIATTETPPRQQADAEQREGEEEDETPLLFMDRLPSDFASNAQLAAIATFMQGSDSEDNDGDGDDDDCGDTLRGASKRRRRDGAPATASYMRRQQKKREGQRERRQAPYAKPKARNSSDAKELQLYLSMFKM